MKPGRGEFCSQLGQPGLLLLWEVKAWQGGRGPEGGKTAGVEPDLPVQKEVLTIGGLQRVSLPPRGSVQGIAGHLQRGISFW